MNVVFAGAPDLAVPTLRATASSAHRVSLVVTQPDRLAGRGRRAHATAVKRAAEALGLRVLQPRSINDPEAVEALCAAAPDVVLVAAYGKRLLRRALRAPRIGCYNVHFSLLPRHRGAAPINYALLAGDAETGITVQRMASRIDAGPIVAQFPLAIREDDTAGALAERLGALSGSVIVSVLDAIETGRAQERKQDETLATEAPALEKRDGLIPWTRSAEELARFVRGMTPWPGAFTFREPFGGSAQRRVIVLAAETVETLSESARHADGPVAKPGMVILADRELLVKTGSGALRLLRVQPESARAMSAEDYLRGYAVHVGDRFREPR